MRTLDQSNRDLADGDVKQREPDLQRNVAQLERLELLGRLSGSVAHDFNNLLTVILGYADIIAAGLPPGDPLNRPLDELRRAGERGAALTKQLLSLGRQRAIQPQAFDMAAQVRGIEEFIRRLIPRNIDFLVRAGAPAWCHGDAGQMEQVIVNLAVNARDAVDAGGRVTITVATVADGVEVAVADTGCGMDAETLEHVFDPFFTTKPEGRGTGLGLPTVQSIVNEHGGELRIDSAPGAGTTVIVLLPPAQAASEANARPASESPAVILVVDDDRTVRRMLEMLLTREGFTVLPAADAEEALVISTTRDGAIDALMTGVVLPGIDGCELAARLRAERPALGAIFMSVHPVDGAVARCDEQLDRFIAKPFVPHAVAETVREVVAAAARGRRG